MISAIRLSFARSLSFAGSSTHARLAQGPISRKIPGARRRPEPAYGVSRPSAPSEAPPRGALGALQAVEEFSYVGMLRGQAQGTTYPQPSQVAAQARVLEDPKPAATLPGAVRRIEVAKPSRAGMPIPGVDNLILVSTRIKRVLDGGPPRPPRGRCESRAPRGRAPRPFEPAPPARPTDDRASPSATRDKARRHSAARRRRGPPAAPTRALLCNSQAVRASAVAIRCSRASSTMLEGYAAPRSPLFWCARAAKIFLAGREFGVSARLSVARSDVPPVYGVLDRRLSSGYGSATAT
jgi:hypothetical protein